MWVLGGPDRDKDEDEADLPDMENLLSTSAAPEPRERTVLLLEPPQMPTQMREGWRFQGWLWALGEMDQYEDRADLRI